MQHQVPRFGEYFKKHIQPSTYEASEERRLWDEFERQGLLHAKEEAHIRSGYTRFAAHWNRLLVPRLAEKQMETIRKYGRIKPTSKVASFGSGTGVFENYIAKYMAPQGKVTAVDLTEAMVKEAARLSRQLGVKNIEHIIGSTYNLNLTGHFDIILAIDHHIHSWEDVGKMTRAFKRVITPGSESRTIITVILPSEHDAPKAINAYRESGFVVIHQEIVSPIKYANHPLPKELPQHEIERLIQNLPKMLLLVGRPA